MTNIKWDLFRDVTVLQDRINRMFAESFQVSQGEDKISAYNWRPRMDIYEAEGKIVIKADLPGVSKEDIQVEVKDNLLILKGTRKADVYSGDPCFFCQERKFGPFQRTFTFQCSVDLDKIKASFKNGVLKITVSEPEEEKLRKIQVNID